MTEPSHETDQRECSPAPVDEHGLTELRSGAPTPTAEPALSEKGEAEELLKRASDTCKGLLPWGTTLAKEIDAYLSRGRG